MKGILLALAIESSYIVGDQHYLILDLSVFPLLVVGCLPTELSALLFFVWVRFIFRKGWYLFIPSCLLLLPIFMVGKTCCSCHLLYLSSFAG